MIRAPKFKTCRKIGDRIYPKAQTPKFSASLSRKPTAKKSRRGRSEFSKQLLEKQKMKLIYGTNEKQFAKYVNKAQGKKGSNPVNELNTILEARLDNVVYRSGITGSRLTARQLVSHGHFLVNGTRVNVPSYHVTSGDKISLRKASQTKTMFANSKTRMKSQAKWLEVDPENFEIKVIGAPLAPESDQAVVLGSVIEFYNRA